MNKPLLSLTVGELVGKHAAISDFMSMAGTNHHKTCQKLEDWLNELSEEWLAHIGMDRDQITLHLEALSRQVDKLVIQDAPMIETLSILGGCDKSGKEEKLGLTIRAGDVVCIVGPTGSGKSRLLGDIECLAQGDTPSGRRVLINGVPPDSSWRFSPDRKLVAQLSQNMNFVVDLSVREFIAMHADCRIAKNSAVIADGVIACANELAGEKFQPNISLTQLSGGQTRALMIADTALLSSSPIVLIDEIENAGIDRKKALDLLIAKEKIVLISTHDPILALLGRLRLVIRNGAVAEIIETSDAERRNLSSLEEIDRRMMDVRHRLRNGQRIEETLSWTTA